MKEVAITGIGIVAPPGAGKEIFWKNIKEGKSFISPIARFDASAYPSQVAGQIENLNPDHLSSRLLKKIDKFSASALMAIGYAARIVRNKKLTFALAGGTEAPVTPYALLCCSTEGSLSKGPYRPFDKERNGFVVGEGAGIVVLENKDSACKRGANIYGLITGFGTSCDGVHRIMPDPNGQGLARAIKIALDTAGYKPEDIDYICADGIATESGDIGETKAIKELFGDYARKIPISAPKSIRKTSQSR